MRRKKSQRPKERSRQLLRFRLQASSLMRKAPSRLKKNARRDSIPSEKNLRRTCL
jgi:hypothetical protein